MRSRLAPRPEDVAVLAVADVEFVADDGEEHRVGAVQQFPVHDGVDARVGRDGRGSASVPAQAMAVFGFHVVPCTHHNSDGGSAT